MEKRAKFHVCGRIVITRGTAVLMGKETTGGHATWFLWETPGGGLRPGETLEQCLQREALEEIGVGVHVKNEMPRFRSFGETAAPEGEPEVQWLLVYCRCEPEGEPDLSRALDNEFAELRFVGEQEFRSLLQADRVSFGERIHLPQVMAELGLWSPG